MEVQFVRALLTATKVADVTEILEHLGYGTFEVYRSTPIDEWWPTVYLKGKSLAGEEPGLVPDKQERDTFGYSTGQLASLLHIYEKHLSELYDLTNQPGVQGVRLRLVR